MTRARIPVADLREQRTASGQRFLVGHVGWSKVIVVEQDQGWRLYFSGAAEVLAAPKKAAKRRAPKAARRAPAKKCTGRMPIDARLPVPDGPGYELNDSLEGIGS